MAAEEDALGPSQGPERRRRLSSLCIHSAPRCRSVYEAPAVRIGDAEALRQVLDRILANGPVALQTSRDDPLVNRVRRAAVARRFLRPTRVRPNVSVDGPCRIQNQASARREPVRREPGGKGGVGCQTGCQLLKGDEAAWPTVPAPEPCRAILGVLNQDPRPYIYLCYSRLDKTPLRCHIRGKRRARRGQ